MAKYKHECICIKDNNMTRITGSVKYTAKCIHCGYRNHTFLYGRYPGIGGDAVICPMKQKKIRWWEFFLISVNMMKDEPPTSPSADKE